MHRVANSEHIVFRANERKNQQRNAHTRFSHTRIFDLWLAISGWHRVYVHSSEWSSASVKSEKRARAALYANWCSKCICVQLIQWILCLISELQIIHYIIRNGHHSNGVYPLSCAHIRNRFTKNMIWVLSDDCAQRSDAAVEYFFFYLWIVLLN